MMVSKPERVPKPTYHKVTAVTGGTGPALTIGSGLSTASMSSGISSGHTSSTSRQTPPTTTSVSTVMAAPESGMTKSLSTGSGTTCGTPPKATPLWSLIEDEAAACEGISGAWL